MLVGFLFFLQSITIHKSIYSLDHTYISATTDFSLIIPVFPTLSKTLKQKTLHLDISVPMTSSQDSILNPKSIKTRFAYRFLRSLKKLNNKSSSSPLSRPCSRNFHRRFRVFRTVAYASMASAVGTRRAWSRAMLCKIKNRRLNNNHVNSIVSIRREGSSREVTGKGNPNLGGLYGTQELRRLVPGGETMDICSLLGETAHYIKCLTTQIQVMRNIVDYYST